MASLIDYPNVRLYIISNDVKKYNQVMQSYSDYKERYHHVLIDDIGDLYASELKLRELRAKIDL